MENNSNNMNTAESLQIIQDMINAVKQDLGKNSFYFLLWGWLVLIASLGHYLLLNMEVEYASIVWLLMPLGGVVTAIYGKKQKKEEQANTYINEFMKYVIGSFGASLFIVLIFQGILGLSTYPMVMVLYGILLFVSGGAIRFKPLMYGGIINWIFAIISFFFTFKIQLLLLAAAVLLGYIIPGYLLKKAEN